MADDDPFAKYATKPAAAPVKPPDADPSDPFAKYAKTPTVAPATPAEPWSITKPFTDTARGVWEGLTGKDTTPLKGKTFGEKVQLLPEYAGATVGQVGRGVGEMITGLAPSERVLAGGATPKELTDYTAAASLGVGASPGVAGEARMAIAPPLTAAQQRLQDFEGVGVTPNVPTIGQGRAAGLTAQAGRVLPYSPVGRGMKRSLADTAQAAERTANQYGTLDDPFQAGAATQNALRRYAADKSQAKSDYGEFDRLMQTAKPTDVSGTLRVIRDLQGRFIDNPGLAKLSSRLEQKLGPPVQNVPAKTSTIVDETGRQVLISPAQTIPRSEILSMKDLKDFRTEVGYRLENPSFGPEDIPRGQLRQLYAALTQDMQRAARAQSPEASRALIKATTNYGMRMRQLDRLEPLLNPDAPERVFQRIELASRGKDSGLLQSVKKAVTPEEWNNVGATMIRNFGNPSAGAAKVAGQPDFSIDTFASNWNKLDDRAKDLIFGTDTPGSARAGLEQLTRVVNAQKAVGKLANTSHTAEVGAAIAIPLDVLQSLFSGRNILPELGAFTGAYGVSKLMMSPAFTRWLYKAPEFSSPEEGMMALSDIVNRSALPAASSARSSDAKARTSLPPVSAAIINGTPPNDLRQILNSVQP